MLIEAITPAWLTQILQQGGFLPDGIVTDLDKTCTVPFGAVLCHLKVRYSTEPTLPDHFVIKLANLADDSGLVERGKAEILFYQQLGANHNLPIPVCYSAAWAEDSYHLLLQDLSETHQEITKELPPTDKQCFQLVETLAHLHTHWWDHPTLGSEWGQPITPDQLERDYQDNQAVYADFAAFLGDRLSPAFRQIYAHLHLAQPALKARLLSRQNLTLCHGDAHTWNFLYPLDPAGQVILLDWERQQINLGTHDLAYMMGHFWHPERRQRLERPLLEHYHRRLAAQGVTDYPWEACWQDYRLSIIHNLFEPAWWWRFNLPAFLWWNRLHNIMAAYQDLKCDELLGQAFIAP